jgi:MFS family permease
VTRGPSTARQLSGLLAADVISTAGTEMSAVALPWFVLVTTGSPVRMGAVLAAEFAGMTVLGLVGGQVATRLGPRRMMLVSDVARAGLIGLIPLLGLLGVLSIVVLLAIGFAVGAFFPAYSASQRLVLADISGGEELRLVRAGGLLNSVNELGSFVGPALGGVLVALLGAKQVLVLDAASYLCAFALVATLIPATVAPEPHTPAPDPEPEHATSGALEGLRYLARSQTLRRQVLGIGYVEIGWTAMTATLPVLALRTHGGSSVAGWLLASYGAGSVVGGLVSARARGTGGRTATAALAVSAGVSWLLLLPVPWWTVAVIVGTTGICAGLFFPRFFSALTTTTPPRLRAQVMTAATIATSAPGPVGFLLAGWLSQSTGTPTASLALVAASATVGAVIVANGTRAAATVCP